MPKAAAKHITPAPTVDPVLELARQLLLLWDADDASQREFAEPGHGAGHLREDTLFQFRDWRNAIEEIISSAPQNL